MLISVFIAIGALFLVLQTTILQSLPGWIGSPDLLFLLIVFAALHLDLFKGAVIALLLGLIMDIFSGIFLGVYPLTYLMLFFLIKAVLRHLALSDLIHQVVLSLIGYLFASGVIYVTVSILAPDSSPAWSWAAMLLQLLILAVLSVPFFHLLQRLPTLLSERRDTPLLSFKRRSGNRFRS